MTVKAKQPAADDAADIWLEEFGIPWAEATDQHAPDPVHDAWLERNREALDEALEEADAEIERGEGIVVEDIASFVKDLLAEVRAKKKSG
jgi:hypothetical protein